MKNPSVCRVVLQPRVYDGMQRGIHKIADAISPTLGPLPRVVAVAPNIGGMPELLDDGGLIARRIIELPDRDEDLGAMYLRSLLWRLHEEVGDGTATAAVMFTRIYDEGLRYVASGGDAMRLRYYLDSSVRLILDELDGMAVTVEGKDSLARLAQSICGDAALARMLGEVFDVIGGYGHIEIIDGNDRELQREYHEGMYWRAGLCSRLFVTNPAEGTMRVEDTAVCITDLEIKEPHDLLPLYEAAVKCGKKALVLVAKSLSDNATALIQANNKPEKFQLMPVKTPGLTLEDTRGALEDMAVLTGGRPLIQAAGDLLTRVTPDDLGAARRGWATTGQFGLIGGKGRPLVLRQHIRQLQERLTATDDPGYRDKIQERIGKLMGGSAMLHVGGTTRLEIDARKALAQRTMRIMRGVMRGGVLPGGGSALLACQRTVQRRLRHAGNSDERAAYRILNTALEAPVRTLLANAGYEPGEIVARIKSGPPGSGFDVHTGRVVNARSVGILDVTAVLKAAVRAAITGASLALTVDVLVHHEKPEAVYQPR